MKTEDLKAKGLNDEQIAFVLEEKGKSIAKLEKEITKLTSENAALKDRAEMAEEMLKSFDGINPDDMKKEIGEWKKKAEDAEKEYQQKIYDRDFTDTLRKELENIKFSSEAAKRSVMSDIKAADLRLKDGKILGLNDFLEQLKENDASAFVNDDEMKARQNAARFTQQIGPVQKPGGMTKDEIMKIKDDTERQNAIANNIHLFNN